MAGRARGWTPPRHALSSLTPACPPPPPPADFPSVVNPGYQLQIGRFLATGADGGSTFLDVRAPAAAWGAAREAAGEAASAPQAWVRGRCACCETAHSSLPSAGGACPQVTAVTATTVTCTACNDALLDGSLHVIICHRRAAGRGRRGGAGPARRKHVIGGNPALPSSMHTRALTPRHTRAGRMRTSAPTLTCPCSQRQTPRASSTSGAGRVLRRAAAGGRGGAARAPPPPHLSQPAVTNAPCLAASSSRLRATAVPALSLTMWICRTATERRICTQRECPALVDWPAARELGGGRPAHAGARAARGRSGPRAPALPVCAAARIWTPWA